MGSILYTHTYIYMYACVLDIWLALYGVLYPRVFYLDLYWGHFKISLIFSLNFSDRFQHMSSWAMREWLWILNVWILFSTLLEKDWTCSETFWRRHKFSCFPFGYIIQWTGYCVLELTSSPYQKYSQFSSLSSELSGMAGAEAIKKNRMDVNQESQIRKFTG